MKVWMLLSLLFSFSVRAQDFTHIKLHPQFEQYLNRPKLKSAAPTALTNSHPVENQIRSVLLGTDTTAKSTGINDPIPTDGEESPLYAEIRKHLADAHQTIGKEHADKIDFMNRQFNLGTSNFSGFSWQKPFGAIHVYADRQVQPPLLVNQWLVRDTFTIEAEATTFLEKARDAGVVAMNDLEIGAFAGITFRRVYTYDHFANSYNEGLYSDFGKLFLSFLRFNPRGVETMANGEFMTREDQWTMSAGGLISTPPLYNFSFSAGVLAEKSFQQKVTIGASIPQDLTSERFRVITNTKNSTTAGVTASLRFDFFKLLSFTILQYDLNYTFESAKELNLSVSAPQWDHINADHDELTEMKTVLHGHTEIKSLEPYVVSLGDTESTALDQRGSLLIWGKLAKTKTELIHTIKGGVVTTWYKNYSSSVSVVQNLLSRLFSAIVYKIFQLPVGAKNAAIYSKNVTLEYQDNHPQTKDPKVARINGDEQFSFVLNHSYEASRTDRGIDKQYKNDVIWFVDSFTNLPKNYLTDIRNNLLKGPMRVESNFRVEKAGFRYLVSLSLDGVYGALADVCNSKAKADWMNSGLRQALLADDLSGAESCVQKLGVLFNDFKADYVANALKPSIAKFKKFVQKCVKTADHVSDLYALFGEANTFHHGTLVAMTSTGMNFQTSFSNGQFRGLGVIDNARRADGNRSPASIGE